MPIRKPLNFLLLSIFWLGISPLHAQNITGEWSGILEAANLRIVLHIEQDESGYKATLDSPDQGVSDVPADDFSYIDDQVSFKIISAGVSYKGKVDADFTSITGTFTQGADLELVLTRGKKEAPKGSPLWNQARLDRQELMIPMRDGVKLFTSVYTPKDSSQKYPILIWRTPYNSEPLADNYTGRLSIMTQLIEEGYIIVFQDVRGKYQSEGKFLDVRPYNPNKKGNKDIDESSDTYDAIDWLVKNIPNNNGRVGIFGISYPGFYSTMSLIESHPALKAVSPQAPVTDWFIGDDFHHNGAFFILDAFNFYSSFGRPRPEPTRTRVSGFDWPGKDNYEFFLDLGPIKNVEKLYFGDTIQFWDDLMSHPNYDDFWKARNPRPHLKNVKPAVLTVGGWFDAEDSFGPLRVYEAIEKQSPPTTNNRLIMGPWYHGQWASDAGDNMGNVHFGQNTGEHYKEVELKFFNYYLKDKGDMDLPEADMFVTGANEWRGFEVWPPANTQTKTLYFHPQEGLSFDAPSSSTESYDEYISDPMNPVPYTEDVHLRRTREYMTDDQRFASRRPDVMVYESEILTEDITITGPVRPKLWVSTTGTDADYVIKLIDVFPDTLSNYPENDKNVPMAGYQMLVRGDILRGRFRNSFENPEPFESGKITQVNFELPDVAHTFKKGHRIMIQVQNSWFPLVDRNPQTFVNIYEADESDFIKATHRIYHDQEHPSGVELMILKE